MRSQKRCCARRRGSFERLDRKRPCSIPQGVQGTLSSAGTSCTATNKPATMHVAPKGFTTNVMVKSFFPKTQLLTFRWSRLAFLLAVGFTEPG